MHVAQGSYGLRMVMVVVVGLHVEAVVEVVRRTRWRLEVCEIDEALDQGSGILSAVC